MDRIPGALAVWVPHPGESERLRCVWTEARGKHGLNQEAMLDDSGVVRSSLVWPSVIAFVLCSSMLLLLGKEMLTAFIRSVQSQCPWFFLPFFFSERYLKPGSSSLHC